MFNDNATGVLLGFSCRRDEVIVDCCFGAPYLRRSGGARLFVGCSADPNVRSYGFYRRLGWRSTGQIDKLGDEVLELRSNG